MKCPKCDFETINLRDYNYHRLSHIESKIFHLESNSSDLVKTQKQHRESKVLNEEESNDYDLIYKEKISLPLPNENIKNSKYCKKMFRPLLPNETISDVERHKLKYIADASNNLKIKSPNKCEDITQCEAQDPNCFNQKIPSKGMVKVIHKSRLHNIYLAQAINPKYTTFKIQDFNETENDDDENEDDGDDETCYIERVKCTPGFEYNQRFTLPESESLSCSVCSFQADDTQTLQIHKNMHVNFIYRCKFCIFTTKDHEDFKIHKDLHMGCNNMKEDQLSFSGQNKCEVKLNKSSANQMPKKDCILDDKPIINKKQNDFDTDKSNFTSKENEIDSLKTNKNNSIQNEQDIFSIIENETNSIDEITNETSSIDKVENKANSLNKKEIKCVLYANKKSDIPNIGENKNILPDKIKINPCQAKKRTKNQSRAKREPKKYDVTLKQANAEIRYFACSQCPYQSRLKHHIKRHELTHLAIKYLKCSKCEYATNNKQSFDRHKLKHVEGIQFKCHLCLYKTNIEGDLKRHSLRHLKDKLFKCSECDYSTNRRFLLQQHWLNHMNVTLYKCSRCNYGTNLKSNLMKHERIHLRSKILKCSKCDFKTIKKIGFEIHKKIHKNFDK